MGLGNINVLKDLEKRIEKLDEARFGEAEEASGFSELAVGEEVLGQQPELLEEKKGIVKTLRQRAEDDEYIYDVWFPANSDAEGRDRDTQDFGSGDANYTFKESEWKKV